MDYPFSFSNVPLFDLLWKNAIISWVSQDVDKIIYQLVLNELVLNNWNQYELWQDFFHSLKCSSCVTALIEHFNKQND